MYYKIMLGRTLSTVLLLYVFVVIARIKTVQGYVDNDSILFAQVRCLTALARSGFDIADFENYPKFFHDDSIMHLAQTGEYKGTKAIEEYVKLAFPGASPYVACCSDFIKREVKFLGYKNGQCEFVNLLVANQEWITKTTNAPSTPMKFVAMLKLYFNFEKRYVQRINVFYADDYLRVVFDLFLNSEDTRQYVCGVINGAACSTILKTTKVSSNVTCLNQLSQLPTTDGKFYVDGNSQGCRAVHAAFAPTNPINHCPHISFAPLKDPNGQVKCQSSKGRLPSALFTKSEFQMFEDFATSVGVDPTIGHTYKG